VITTIWLAFLFTVQAETVAPSAKLDPPETYLAQSKAFTWAGRFALIGGEVALFMLSRVDRPERWQTALYGYALPAISTGCVFWATSEATLGLKSLGIEVPRPVWAGLGLGMLMTGYPLTVWAFATDRDRSLAIGFLALTQTLGVVGFQIQGFQYRRLLRAGTVSDTPAEDHAGLWLTPFVAPVRQGALAGFALRF
jgi:hypothetical protein